jgi:hypothetical protein
MGTIRWWFTTKTETDVAPAVRVLTWACGVGLGLWFVWPLLS